jgi:hypothetical protein
MLSERKESTYVCAGVFMHDPGPAEVKDEGEFILQLKEDI